MTRGVEPRSTMAGGGEGEVVRYRETHLCPKCSGIGFEFYNETRDPETGVWERDERDCTYCAGTGLLVAT